MKNFRLLFMFLATVLFAVSCTEMVQEDELSANKKATFYGLERWNDIDFNSVQIHDLIGGQTILMGTVVVGNDDDSLYVKYEASEGYVITETHLFVGDVMSDDFPKSKKNNPKIGHFPYAAENFGGSSIVIYSISLDEVPDVFDVAAHAVVQCEDGTCEETAWGAGKIEGEVVIASKTWFSLGEIPELYGVTSGVSFADECFEIGYIPIDLDNFVATSYPLVQSDNTLLGSIDVSMTAENLHISVNGIPDFTEVVLPYLFIGTTEGLLDIFEAFGCPYYYHEFPYTETEVDIPLAGLMTSSESYEFDSNRWGFYFEYTVK